jgi:uncharacterized protein
MILGIPAGELALLLGALLAAGFLTGLLAGLLGIGGGGILVPVLYELFGALGVDEIIRMHLSVGTSLAVIIPTSLRSFSAHRARGAVDMELLKSMALPVIAGVCLGAALARYSDDAGLKAIWVLAAVLMGIRLYFGRRGWQLGDEIPGTLGFIWAGWRVAGLPPGSLGYVSLLGALLIIPASVLAAPLGVRIAHGISRRKLELAFATFLMVVSLRFLLSL